MSRSLHYTEPKLYHFNFDLSKDWFIGFTVTDIETKEKKRLQFRGGINYSKVKLERIKLANVRIEYWKREIRKGYTPFDTSATANDMLAMTLKASIEFGLEKCDVAKKTKLDYSGTARYIIKSAEAVRLHVWPIAGIKRMHIKMILEHAKTANKWSNVSYNKHLNYLQAILKRIVDWEIIENNPAHNIAVLPVAETEKYIPYTEAEKRAIQEYLFVHHYRFFVYLICIYSTGIRPKEILALKIKDVDLIYNQITILPNIKTENSKTRKIRKVPINKHLQLFLKQLEIEKYSRESYLFGSPYEPGKGNRGSSAGGLTGAMHPDYFKPSMTHIKRDTVTRLWKTIVMDKLGIQKHLYAAKKTGANAMILAGIDLDTIKTLFGHSSKLTTEIYATEIKKVRFNEIIDKSPGF